MKQDKKNKGGSIRAKFAHKSSHNRDTAPNPKSPQTTAPKARMEHDTRKLRKTIEALQVEVAQSRRAEEQARLLFTFTQAISIAQDFEFAVEVALGKTCETIGWDIGEAWIPRADGVVLECSPVWCECKKGLKRFRTMSEALTFAPGAGLPGRVWLSKQPEWIEDISVTAENLYPRAKIAETVGLRAALGVPVIARDQVLAVLVFFLLEPRKEDKLIVETVFDDHDPAGLVA